jgi:hypothetical protein
MSYEYEWPGEFTTADEQIEISGVSMFNDHGTVYMTGGERTEEYMWMDGIPTNMENSC